MSWNIVLSLIFFLLVLCVPFFCHKLEERIESHSSIVFYHCERVAGVCERWVSHPQDSGIKRKRLLPPSDVRTVSEMSPVSLSDWDKITRVRSKRARKRSREKRRRPKCNVDSLRSCFLLLSPFAVTSLPPSPSLCALKRRNDGCDKSTWINDESERISDGCLRNCVSDSIVMSCYYRVRASLKCS